MNSTQEFLKQALDNATVKESGTGNIATTNPTIWDRDVSKYCEANLVMKQLGEVYDFRGVGGSYVVTIDAAPSASSVQVEATEIALTGMAFTQVTFTPTEYGSAFQVTDKEKRRSLVDIMANATKKLGYMYAQAIDAKIMTVVLADTTNDFFVNDKTAVTLAAVDTLGVSSFTKALRTFEDVDYEGYASVLSPAGIEQIRNLDTFHEANKYGSSTVLKTGLVGNIMGFDVYKTSKIASTEGTIISYKPAIFLASTNISGEKPFGLCIKADPSIESERHARARTTDLVAVGEFDAKVLHGAGIVTISHYSGANA